MTEWLSLYWPWAAPLLFLIVYEIWAIATGRRTLSRIVWIAKRRYPPLVWIVLIVVGVLLVHFFWPGTGGG